MALVPQGYNYIPKAVFVILLSIFPLTPAHADAQISMGEWQKPLKLAQIFLCTEVIPSLIDMDMELKLVTCTARNIDW